MHKLTKRLAAALLAAVLLALALPSAGAANRRTIRVGFPIQNGLTEIAPDGGYTGYTYDYLMAVAQYTNWNYEFVKVEGELDEQLTTLLNMLETGEIDILGAMSFQPALSAIYDYASVNYGTASNVLCVLEENAEITSSNYFTLPELRVAVLEGATSRREKLAQFAGMNSFQVVEVPCGDETEMMAALHDGRADALLHTDVSGFDPGLRIIARFAPQPFYFAIHKGQDEIVTELNRALVSVQESDPYFTTQLYEKYFSSRHEGLYLSQAEKEYIAAQTEPLRVLLMGGRAPLQYRDEDGKPAGITVEVLDKIAELTGLTFTIEIENTWERYEKRLRAGEADLVGGAIGAGSNLLRELGYHIGASYMTAPNTLVVSNRVDPRDLTGKRLALPYGYDYTGEYVGKMIHFDTIEDCIDAIRSAKADYSYGNTYSVQYYFDAEDYRDLTIVPQGEEWSQEYGIGVSPDCPSVLLPLIEKAVANIPESSIREAFLYNNATRAEDLTLWNVIRANPAPTAAAVLLVLALFAAIMTRRYMQMNRQRLLEAEWYEQISALTNEFIYEYNIARDQLKLPEKSARMFGGSRTVHHLSQRRDSGMSPELVDFILAHEEGQHELECRLQNGETRWFRITSKNVVDDQGKTVYSIGKVSDIQDEKEIHAALLERAQRDSRTGLYNAVASRQLISDELAKYTPEDRGALLMFDIDRFKEVNDTHGHLVGDEVIKAVAEALRDEFRKADIIGRQGGDEFVVFMHRIHSPDDVEGACSRVSQRVAELGEPALRVTISIGAVPLRAGDDLEERYERADQALYAAKNEGRNRWSIDWEP